MNEIEKVRETILRELPLHEWWLTPDVGVFYVDVDHGLAMESTYVRITIETAEMPDVAPADVLEGAAHPYGWKEGD